MRAFIAWIRENTSRRVRRFVVAAVGGSMALAGLLLLVLPGLEFLRSLGFERRRWAASDFG